MAVTNVFDEILFDPSIFTAGEASGGPEYANTMLRNPPTGIYKVNVPRYDFQQVWTFDLNLLTASKRDYIMQLWVGGLGSGYPLRVWIYNDFYALAEVLGTSDGTIASRTWKLTKTYRRPGANHSYVRRIIKPVVNALVVGGVTLYEPNGTTPRVIPTANGGGLGIPAFSVFIDTGGGPVATTAYTVNNTTGVITLTATPANGAIISWSGEFDTPMRFLQNSLPFRADVASEVRGIQMVECLPAEFGIV